MCSAGRIASASSRKACPRPDRGWEPVSEQMMRQKKPAKRVTKKKVKPAKRAGTRTEIRIKRAYEAVGGEDGLRILIDRLWPRGLSKTALKLDAWVKHLAPSNELRKWYKHD